MKRLLSLVAVVVVLFITTAMAAAPVIYTVQPGDYLVRIARRVGQPDKAYLQLVRLNPDLFSAQTLYHPSHNQLEIGARLVVPAEWAAALGLVPPSPKVQIAGPVLPLSLPVPSEGGQTQAVNFWEDPLFWLAVVLVLFGLYLAGRRQVDAVVNRAIREVGYTFFPLQIDPIYDVGTGEAALALGTSPSSLVLTRVSGQYQLNHRRRDGTLYSRIASVKSEEAYTVRGSDGNEAVFKGCGNPAVLISPRPEPVTRRLTEAARRTLRQTPEAPPVVIRPQPETPPEPRPEPPKPPEPEVVRPKPTQILGSRPWYWEGGRVGVWEGRGGNGISAGGWAGGW